MILCTFEDGTTELRPADSSAIAAGGSFRLWMLRGDPTAQVPRGGEWVPCRVETSDEQIDRLTRERDLAVAALQKIAKHNATARWNVEKQAMTDQDGEPWVHWADIARDALARLR